MVQFLKNIEPLSTTHSGREKMMRFCQYFSAFLMPTIENMNNKSERSQDLVKRLGLIKSNMSLTRKVMRFGGSISIILNIIKRFKDN